MDKIDHYIKERLRIKYYLRYMDDMLIIDHDKKKLESIRDDINVKLQAMGFELHSKKTKIIPIRQGVMFLGFIYRLTKTGKVVMNIDPERVKAIRRKLYRLVKKSKAGYLSREKVDESYQCWRNHASKGDSWK